MTFLAALPRGGWSVPGSAAATVALPDLHLCASGVWSQGRAKKVDLLGIQAEGAENCPPGQVEIKSVLSLCCRLFAVMCAGVCGWGSRG